MATNQGYPPTIAVPGLYRVLRSLSVTSTATVFDISAEPVGADVLAEVLALYPAVTVAQIRAKAVIKQVDVVNTGYNASGASQTTAVAYYEHPNTYPGTPTGPTPNGAQSVLWPGQSASYPSPLGRQFKRLWLQAQGSPAVAQTVNVIVWFDVPGFGT